MQDETTLSASQCPPCFLPPGGDDPSGKALRNIGHNTTHRQRANGLRGQTQPLSSSLLHLFLLLLLDSSTILPSRFFGLATVLPPPPPLPPPPFFPPPSSFSDSSRAHSLENLQPVSTHRQRAGVCVSQMWLVGGRGGGGWEEARACNGYPFTHLGLTDIILY